MKNLILIFSLVISAQAFSQTTKKIEPTGSVESVEPDSTVTTETPAAMGSTNHSVRVKKKGLKVPSYIAPATNTGGDANCAGSLGKGDSSYTACQAGKGTR